MDTSVHYQTSRESNIGPHPVATALSLMIRASPHIQELDSKAHIHYSPSQEDHIAIIDHHPAVSAVSVAMVPYHW